MLSREQRMPRDSKKPWFTMPDRFESTREFVRFPRASCGSSGEPVECETVSGAWLPKTCLQSCFKAAFDGSKV